MCSPFENLLLSFYFKDCLDFTHHWVQNELEYSNFTSFSKDYLFVFLASKWSFFCALVLCTNVCPFTVHLQLCTSLISRVE